ncbi:hypothetical protein BV898_02197 [Hypsibius exemplaris]|uniref:Uncharacterized protein n=1 Tax=Hypsibius exemplaris TaxID=2072580 RepID=A0A1W0X8K0_HYPEX|nr:hypothetical protein BV898_02197 [Hypsibius exemplaris]
MATQQGSPFQLSGCLAAAINCNSREIAPLSNAIGKSVESISAWRDRLKKQLEEKDAQLLAGKRTLETLYDKISQTHQDTDVLRARLAREIVKRGMAIEKFTHLQASVKAASANAGRLKAISGQYAKDQKARADARAGLVEEIQATLKVAEEFRANQGTLKKELMEKVAAAERKEALADRQHASLFSEKQVVEDRLKEKAAASSLAQERLSFLDAQLQEQRTEMATLLQRKSVCIASTDAVEQTIAKIIEEEAALERESMEYGITMAQLESGISDGLRQIADVRAADQQCRQQTHAELEAAKKCDAEVEESLQLLETQLPILTHEKENDIEALAALKADEMVLTDTISEADLRIESAEEVRTKVSQAIRFQQDRLAEELREEELAENRRRAEKEAAEFKAIEAAKVAESLRKAAEEAARQKAAEEAGRQKAAEEAARQKAAEEAARQKAVEEAARQKAAEEALRQKAADEEEVRQKTAEEEALKKAVEEEARKKAAEVEALRKLAEQAARKKAEEEEARAAAVAEGVLRRAAEMEALKKAAEKSVAARMKAEKEAARKEAAEEEARLKAAEQEALRKAAEEEKALKKKKALEEQERKKAVAAEKARLAAERKEQELEKERREEEERIALAEQEEREERLRREEEEERRAIERARKASAAQKKAVEDAAAKKRAEAKERAAAAEKKAAETRMKAEDDASQERSVRKAKEAAAALEKKKEKTEAQKRLEKQQADAMAERKAAEARKKASVAAKTVDVLDRSKASSAAPKPVPAKLAPLKDATPKPKPIAAEPMLGPSAYKRPNTQPDPNAKRPNLGTRGRGMLTTLEESRSGSSMSDPSMDSNFSVHVPMQVKPEDKPKFPKNFGRLVLSPPDDEKSVVGCMTLDDY